MKIYEYHTKKERTERIIQFGEGGFLRGFVSWMIQKLNDSRLFDGSIVIVQPIKDGRCADLASQNCLYTHVIRGAEGEEKTLVDSVSRCINPYEDFDAYLKLAENPHMRFIVSNTTEAGIAYDENDKISDTPPKSFPAKLTLLLHKRFTLGLPGFVLLPCELIEKNGEKLR
jgi:tagaturonate reductase